MKKINKLKVTKEKFQEYHKLFWNEIISILELNHLYVQANVLKYTAFDRVFNESILIEAHCFGCEWSRYGFDPNHCADCLFETDMKLGCLSGLWNKFCKKPTAEIAKLIRDFPLRGSTEGVPNE